MHGLQLGLKVCVKGLIHRENNKKCQNSLSDFCLSGLLSGKFKRGEVPDPSGSRIGWVKQDEENRSNQSHPSLAQYADKESFWCLLDTMQSIAQATGALIIFPHFS